MGIGLIMAGLGQGIAQGGQTFGNAAIKSYEDERRDALETRREAALLNRQEALISARSAQEKRDAEDLSQTQLKQAQAAEVRAAEKPVERATGQVLERGAIAGANPELMQSPDELKAYMKDHPEYRKQLESSGIIAKETRLTKAEDEAKAAMELGAHSSVIKAFQGQRDAVLKEISEERKAKAEQTRLDQGETRLDILGRNADTAAKRAEDAASKAVKGESKDRLTTIVNSQNATIKSLNDQGKGQTPESKAAWQKQMDVAVGLRDRANQQLNTIMDERENKPTAPASTGVAKPKTQNDFDKLPSGTRYTDPNGVTRIKR